uniref:Uncharacterized protein n=1 Tax=Kalanchoe fedtschenkoi TaxID=63787 RepID=A0A7N0ZZU3_KALFE
MAKIQSTLVYFSLLALITCQESIFTEGRFLSLIDKANRRDRGSGKKQDINSRPVEHTNVQAKQNDHIDLGKPDVVRDGDTHQTAITTYSQVSHPIRQKTSLDGGKYNVEEKQQGHSPGVGHPFAPREDATKWKIQVEGKTQDYSPGVGHSLPTNNEYTRPEAAVGTSILADKHNAGGKPSDYSPGVGHSSVHFDRDITTESVDNSPNENRHIQHKTQDHSPGVGHAASVSDDHTATEVRHNNNKVRDELSKEEQIRIESHSPGVGHSIQQKHAEPRAKK